MMGSNLPSSPSSCARGGERYRAPTASAGASDTVSGDLGRAAAACAPSARRRLARRRLNTRAARRDGSGDARVSRTRGLFAHVHRPDRGATPRALASSGRRSAGRLLGAGAGLELRLTCFVLVKAHIFNDLC